MRHLVVLFEHPEWQKPLFDALEKAQVPFSPFDLKAATFDPSNVPRRLSDEPLGGTLFFNQASPSAYVRGHTRAVPFALALMRCLEARGRRVLNGAQAFAFELSKTSQAAVLAELGIAHPRSLAFNDTEAVLREWKMWPALLKPEQGGSGARMVLLQNGDELRTLLASRPDFWLPEHLLLLQEYFPIPEAQGIVRMEFLGGKLLYAMRVVSHGAFNLCPSELCNPDEGDGACVVPSLVAKPKTPVEFFPYPEVPVQAVEAAQRILQAAHIDVGGVEYLEASDGRLVFYDINANSNLRPAIAASFGFNPFERVAQYLASELSKTGS